MTSPHIFKAYDIRGVYPTELNEETAFLLGRAFVTLMQKEQKRKKLLLAVGRDMRLSSPVLATNLIRGMTTQGADVLDLGLVSTPTFYFAVVHYQTDGGVVVSASHNPKEYNGFKLVRHHAIPISGETGIRELQSLIEKNVFPKKETQGKVTLPKDVLKEHVVHDLRFVSFSEVTSPIKPFTIVADAANSMGALYLEELFHYLPCRLIKVNFTLDGTFPAHQPDPLQEKNLEQLKQKILEVKADLGIAPDGDGDRVFFVDNKGQTVPQPILRGLLAQIFLQEHPRAKICYDIRPGKITKDMILEAGGKPILTRVGHSLIKEVMRKEKAIFAGESSGHYFLHVDDAYYEVPMIIILKILQWLSAKNKSFATLMQPYKKYVHSGEINVVVKNKEQIMQNLAQHYKDAQEISWLDGVTITYDTFWFNVRQSNTEPLLRLNLEAVSASLMKKKRDEVLSFMKE
ncbi:phosphomannomutase/phosphoglucomutase [Candidatus Woesearchaeota archaeon]|nr:phosphomannomutase/phosphoglucomutase [Candidatus Woesearchaeota archaeon]